MGPLIFMLVIFGVAVLIANSVIKSKGFEKTQLYKSTVGKDLSLPHKVVKVCPYCGAEGTYWYTPANEPYPRYFHCYDGCERHYGDSNLMTSEQRATIREEENICARIENMPELQQVVDAVWNYFNYRAREHKNPKVYIRDGLVYVYRYTPSGYNGTQESKFEKEILCSYPRTTEVGDLHLCAICCRKLQAKYHGLRFERGYCEITYKGIDM